MSTIDEFAEECGTTDDARESSQHEETQIKETKPSGSVSDLKADKEREKWCHGCNLRVTVAPGGNMEYGHAKTCERYCHRGEN